MTTGTTGRTVHAMVLLFSSMPEFAYVSLNQGFDFLRIDLTGAIVINLRWITRA